LTGYAKAMKTTTAARMAWFKHVEKFLEREGAYLNFIKDMGSTDIYGHSHE